MVDATREFNRRAVGHVRRCSKVIAISISRNGDEWSCVAGVWPQASHLNHEYINEESFPSHFTPATHQDIDMSVATPDDAAPEGYTTVHGYYRFTDIFYEWCARFL